MPADGGPARRLTWLGPDTLVRGWTPQGHILFVSTHGQPFFRNHQAFTLDPAGGMPQPLNLGQVNHLSFGPGNARVIGRNTADPARWKRYRGGTAGHLWIDAAGSGHYRRMSELHGNLSCPMWIGERVYFLSDAEGVGNLYSCRPDGSDARRHTDHADYYARHAQSDGRRIVYQCARTPLALRSSQWREPCARPARAQRARAGGAPLRAGRDVPGRGTVAPAGTQPGARRARQAVHAAAVGGRGEPARRGRRRALPPCAVAGRWPHAAGRQRRQRRRARRTACRRHGARARLGHRPRQQSAAPRRRARGWPWPTTATSCCSAMPMQAP